MADIDTIRKERLAKIERLKEAGMEAYPVHSNRTHTIGDFIQNHQMLEEQHEAVVIAGRIMSIRDQGGVMFADLFDGTEKTQVVLQADADMSADLFELFKAAVDSGDIIEVPGYAFTTKRGMKSLQATGWRMLAKSLLPVPDEFYGIKDEDERFRKRYLDILSKETADRIRRRSAFWNTIRTYLLNKGFVEVETPVLETTTGGADARPFVTHHNALDIDVFLRISAGELWQKRLMVAGLPKVFEIGRIETFRIAPRGINRPHGLNGGTGAGVRVDIRQRLQ